jgi:hypothetical protein
MVVPVAVVLSYVISVKVKCTGFVKLAGKKCLY